jgi:hypothetical protein
VDIAFPILLAITTAYGCALVAGLLLRWPGGFARGAAAGAVPLILATPLLIPPERVKGRALAAFVATDLMFRMVDFLRYRRRHKAAQVSLRDYTRFLIPFPILLVVFSRREQARRGVTLRRPDWPRILGGAALFAGAFLLLDLAQDCPIMRSSFLLDHVVKVLIYLVAIEALAQSLWGLERLAGYNTSPVIQFAFLSRSPAEFWRRYNTRIHAWLYYNAFVPVGGLRAPVRGICLTMLVSGILHELMFAIATSRVDGYQLTFFLLQIPGILASPGLERLARHAGLGGKAVAHGLTIFWMTATSVFFFHGMNRIFPFIYASEPWLP